MDKKTVKALISCIEQARRGETSVNVFDLMYETNFTYPELKGILDKLVAQNELAVTDIKTYEFIGDINRNLEELKNPPRVAKNRKDEQDEYAEKLAFLEQRRREIIRRIKSEDDEDDWPVFHYDEDELDDEFSDERQPVDDFGIIGGEYAEILSNIGADKFLNLTVFIQELIQERRKVVPSKKVPAHPSWENEADLLQRCGELIIFLICSDKTMGRQGAIKKAEILLDEIRETGDAQTSEAYERIIFELKNMSNYYYLKLRASVV